MYRTGAITATLGCLMCVPFSHCLFLIFSSKGSGIKGGKGGGVGGQFTKDQFEASMYF